MKYLKIFIFSTVTLILLLVSAEVTLRIASLIVHHESNLNDVHAEDDKSFRILTLGESTTSYGYFADGVYAWPYILEKMATKQGYKVRVYNTAVSAITSSHILDKLPEQLDKYNPDLIVSMMGINDIDNLHYKSSIKDSTKTLKMYNSLRLLKLKRWIIQFLNRKKIIKNRNIKIKKIVAILKQDLLTGKKRIKEEFPKQEIDAHLLSSVFWLLMPKYKSLETVDLRPLVFISNYALKLFPNSTVTLEDFFRIQSSINTNKCALFGIRYLKSGKKLSPAADTLLGYCLSSEKKLMVEYLKLVKNRVYVENKNEANLNPNYKLLIKECTLSHKKLILMQYPTLSIEKLKTMVGSTLIKKSNHLYFLENKDNFKHAVEKTSFKEVFRDRFRPTWGHTTKFGHEIIAKNVLDFLIKKNLITK